ncbi:MAG: DMT family transporter [Bacteroidetes bacterium]|nr:DMT family transporter [Bacteroidota bacterium]MCL2302450.1 DMT family transporter [Lentimicrobiaceae bacterium]
MKIQFKNYLHLHFIVLIYGFTGILGKLIALPAHYLVFYRLMLTIPIIYVVILFRKESLKIDKQTLLRYLGIGVIIGLHWLTFFHSIKVSNVSVALSCFASSSLFAGILEPLIEKKRIRKLEIFSSVIVLIALCVMLGFEIKYWQGALFGVLAAFLAALFTVLNKQLAETKALLTLSLYELVGALIPIVVVLGVSIFFVGAQNFVPLQNAWQMPTISDFGWLLLLASICTAYPFVAVIKLLRSLTAFTVSLAVNFEPIYSIIFAYLIFGESERMTPVFYAGLCVVFGVVFLYPVLKRDAAKTNILRY